MPAQPRKSTAAVAARREVRAEKGKPAPLQVKFRGETFAIPRDRLGSARVFLLVKKLEKFNTVGDEVEVLFEILGQRDSARFIALMKPGDEINPAYAEFMAAVNKAASVPNS